MISTEKVIALIGAIFTFHMSIAQELPSNSIYLEIFGNGGFYTLNYEKTFQVKDELFNLRVGFGDYPIKVGDELVHRIGVPFGLSKDYHLSELFTLQAGIGVSYIRGLDIGSLKNDTINITEPSKGIYLVPSIGIAARKKRFFFRFNYDPLFAVVDLTKRGEFRQIPGPAIKSHADLYLPEFESKLFHIGLAIGLKL